MLRKLSLLFGATFILFYSATAQSADTWSLEKCVNYARQNNLSVKLAQNTIRNAELTQKQSRMNRLPNLDASISGGYQFGRTIDPTTNEFKTESIGFNSYNINSGIMVFAGNQISNSIKQSKIDLQVAQYDAANTSNTISLSVANAYLNILLAEEQLDNVTKRRDQTQRQLDQTNKLIQAGSLPENDRLDIVAQLALDEQSIIDAKNLVELNYLNIKQLMMLDANADFKIERPTITIPVDANPEALTVEDVFATALGTQPQVKSAGLRVQSAQVGVQLARAGYMPTLTAFGSLRTNYSTLAQSINGFTTQRISQTVFIDDNPVVIGQDVSIPNLQKTGFGDQFNENFGQSLGLSLSIPIYSNHRNAISTERARLGVINAEVSDRQVRQQLKTDIQGAVANARSSKLSYEAAQRSVNAAQIAYDNAQRRFDLGAVNTLQLMTAGNNLDLAKVNLTRAKYQYLFNLKVVDFYLGKEIKIQ